jgi:hypothetical protein
MLSTHVHEEKNKANTQQYQGHRQNGAEGDDRALFSSPSNHLPKSSSLKISISIIVSQVSAASI